MEMALKIDPLMREMIFECLLNKTLNKIFAILSNNQEVDHPLSEDCAKLLIENYQLKFDQSQKEKNLFIILRKLKR